MKITKTTLFSAMLMLVYLFTSCGNDDNENSADIKIKLDEYAVYGEIHNKILEDAFDNLLEQDVSKQGRSMNLTCLEDLKNNLSINFYTLYTENEKVNSLFNDKEIINKSAIIGMNSLLDYDSTKELDLSQSRSIGTKESNDFTYFKKTLFDKIEYYTKDTIDNDLFNEEIRTLSIDIEKANLSEQEEVTLMIALNIAKGSYSYWKPTIEKWSAMKKSNGITKMTRTSCSPNPDGDDNGGGRPSGKPEICQPGSEDGGNYDYGKVVGADVGGAITGAIGGALVGGAGAGPGALAGGCVASIGEGVSQLWNNW